MKVIATMPNHLGENVYPNGKPVPPDQITFHGSTIEQIHMRSLTSKENPYDMPMLRDYIKYFLNAPCWKIYPPDRIKIENATMFAELISICVSNGLDPFVNSHSYIKQ